MAELNLKESYVVDAEGKKVGVLLSLSAYQELINRLRELETFRSANDVSLVDEILSDDEERVTRIPVANFRPRRGPGGMIVI